MRDLCRAKAQVPNESYIAREIVELPELVRDSSLKVRLASLSPRHKVWTDGADAQVFCLGVLSLTLAKDIYTTPSEVLVDNVAKNLVTVRQLTCFWKLKDETRPLAIAAAKARASEATAKLDEAKRGEAETLKKVKALEEEL
ncbi:hypothetical protein B296_00030011 [Ensete ventricosum]|uniref:Uncharacterized protein n=1 Tax=Ensete ventricosum TaxID=4639 RepID=A0A426Z555_ENSVE|nr:hypothetical protein B296_00030011 [Ensete ventricosum]